MNIESKMLTPLVILKHRATIRFEVQAGKSQIEVKRVIDAAGDGPHVSMTIFHDQRKRRPQIVYTSVTEKVPGN